MLLTLKKSLEILFEELGPIKGAQAVTILEPTLIREKLFVQEDQVFGLVQKHLPAPQLQKLIKAEEIDLSKILNS